MKFINLTPHKIYLNDGRVFEPSGIVARVSCNYTHFSHDISYICYGKVENLPEEHIPNQMYIVSALVLNALKGERSDVVAPATGHPDCKRNDQGQIISVPGFVQY